MSKLYSMIEDALAKKGLHIPSDSFTFNEDNAPTEEKLDKSEPKDDFEQLEMPHLLDKSLKPFNSENKTELDDILSDKELNELKSYITEKDINNSEVRKFYNQLASIYGENFFKEIAADLYKFWSNSEAVHDEVKKIQNLIQNGKDDESKEKVEKLKRDLIDNFIASQSNFLNWYLGIMQDPVLNNYRSKSIDYLLNNFATVNTGGTVSFQDNIISNYYSSDLYKPTHGFDEIEVLSLNNVKDDPNVISIYANVEKVKSVLRNNAIPTDYIYAAFPFVDMPGHEPWKVKIMGVPAKKEEQYPLDYVYLERWKSQGNDNTIHKKSSTIYKVPTDLLRQQLPDITPDRVRGTPVTVRNEGEFIQLTDEQIEHVLLQQMYDYKVGRNDNDMFADDLIKTFREHPSANIIRKALQYFEPDVKVRRGTKDKMTVYYINIPYEGSDKRLDTGVNPDLRRFNKLVGK